MARLFKIIAIVILFSGFVPTIAQAQTQSKIGLTEWIAYMIKAMPEALCRSDFYFTSCFKVTKLECEKKVIELTTNCADKLKPGMPATLTLPDDGKNWGGKLGECTGLAYDVAFKAVRINSAKCNDPNAWK